MDLGQIGDLLSVRYALQGSVNQFCPVVVVTVELSDCRTQDVVWVERLETEIDKIHELRSKIVGDVTAALEIFIPKNEAEAVETFTTENLDAWANYHVGLRHTYLFSKDNNALATEYFERAIA